MLLGKREREERIRIYEFAIFYNYIARSFSYYSSVIAVIEKCVIHTVSAMLVCRKSELLFFFCQCISVSISARSECFTAFDKNVISSKTESTTRSVENAVSYNNIIVIKACNSVITCVKLGVFDQNIIAGAYIKSVVSAKYS